MHTVAVSVDVAESQPDFHCHHEDGARISMRLTSVASPNAIYLHGTISDIRAWLARVEQALPLLPQELWAEHAANSEAAAAVGYFDRGMAAE